MECACEATVGYALCDPETRKAHRFSFSVSLLNLIQQSVAPHMRVCKVHYSLGVESTPPLYAVVKAKDNFILRVTPVKELAEAWNNDRTLIVPVKIERVTVL